MRNKLIYIISIVVLFLIGFFIAQNYNEEVKTVKRTRILLGTLVDIQVRNSNMETAEDAISKAFDEIKRIDKLFTVLDQGTVWELNQEKDSVIIVDDEIYNMAVLCDSLYKLSSGNFDAAIGTLINLWGFDKKTSGLPSDSDIKKALLKSGWKNVKLSGKNGLLRTADVRFNFSAAAKGYAVDRAIDVLKNAGIEEALVNAGGEIKAAGGNWIIGVQHPDKATEIIKKIKLEDISVATSGDYENYFEKDGIRYHHLLNPKTGYPAKEVRSVTVIHKNNAFADAMATAVFVLGREKGIVPRSGIPRNRPFNLTPHKRSSTMSLKDFNVGPCTLRSMPFWCVGNPLGDP
ncbi:MAG: FAD:protein FMN transferase, partial [Ignavibacteriaceae bacterium]